MKSKYETIKLGTIIKQVRGISYKKQDLANEQSENHIPVLRANNISNGKLNYKDLVFVNKEKIKPTQMIKKGDIIIATSSGSLSVVGKAAQACEDLNMSFGAFCKLMRSSDKVDPKYVGYYFQSPKYRQTISSLANGANINNIKNEHIDELIIPLPPLETQKKIVEVLDKAQGLIDARKEQIRLMDELIQSIFYEMFGDPVTNPKGWEVNTVENVCSNIMGGGTPSKSNPDYYVGEIPWVTPKDMKLDFISDSIDHINEDAIRNSSAKLIPEQSVLMVIRSGILKRKLPVAINRRCVAINQDMKAFLINKNSTNNEFFMYFWKSCEKYILSKVRAVTADNIEFKQIKDMPYILPPIEFQNEFSKKVLLVQENKEILEAILNELEKNLSSLMQTAFSGDLFNDLVVEK